MIYIKWLIKFFLFADKNTSGKIRRIEFYNIMVSLWQRPLPCKPSKFICLGVLIRSNRIFVTTLCASRLTSYNDTMIKFEGYAVHDVLSPETKIVSEEEVCAGSKFSILYVSNSTFL